MCSDFDMKALATAGLAFRRTRFALKHENTTLDVGCTSTCESENCVTFAFDDGPPLRLSLGGYQECGTGGQLWDASVVLALFLRKHQNLIDGDVVELGAGCGLPGIDVARRRGIARSVTPTDVPQGRRNFHAGSTTLSSSRSSSAAHKCASCCSLTGSRTSAYAGSRSSWTSAVSVRVGRTGAASAARRSASRCVWMLGP